MRSKRRIHSNRGRNRSMHLDPHFFTGLIPRRSGASWGSSAPGSPQVDYEITMNELLEDLSFGRE